MLLLVPESLLAAATAAVAGIGSCRVGALPAGVGLTCGVVRQLGGGERCVAVFRGGSVEPLAALLERGASLAGRIESGELDAAVVFSRAALPLGLQQRISAGCRPLLQRWGSDDLVLCCANVLQQQGAGEFPGSLLGLRLATECVGGEVGGGAGRGLSDVELAAVLPAAVPGVSGVPLAGLQCAIDRCISELGLRGVAARCFTAGLLLYWDFAEESHQISQTMEGRGNPRTADYWHGIMHRREPDAGNAGYWFRRVGDHPVLRQLGLVLEDWVGDLGAGAEVLARVRGLVRGGRLDPFRLIELSTEVVRESGRGGRSGVLTDAGGAELSVAERVLRLVQHLEMVQLLLWDVG